MTDDKNRFEIVGSVPAKSAYCSAWQSFLQGGHPVLTNRSGQSPDDVEYVRPCDEGWRSPLEGRASRGPRPPEIDAGARDRTLVRDHCRHEGEDHQQAWSNPSGERRLMSSSR